MFSTWDRYPAAASRRLREVGRRRTDSMSEFLASLDVLIYAVGAGLTASVVAIVLA
jgi:hypothetical protein